MIVWFVLCPPDWCRDVLPKLWQGALMAGIIFIYFGSCPLCQVTPIGSLLAWGVVLLLVGAGLLLWWVLSCRPSQCETVWRLLELGVVNTIIGGIETAIACCRWRSASPPASRLLAGIFLWLVNAFLDFLVFLLPRFCGFNPVAPAAFGPFRRPPLRPRPDPFRRRVALQRRPEAAQRAGEPVDGDATAVGPPPAPIRNKRGRDCGCGRR